VKAQIGGGGRSWMESSSTELIYFNCKRVKQSKKTNNKGFDAINVSRYCLLYCVLLLLLLLLLGNLFLGIWNSGCEDLQ
jgi:hypothetical protein